MLTKRHTLRSKKLCHLILLQYALVKRQSAGIAHCDSHHARTRRKVYWCHHVCWAFALYSRVLCPPYSIPNRQKDVCYRLDIGNLIVACYPSGQDHKCVVDQASSNNMKTKAQVSD